MTTRVSFLLDESGSMMDRRRETLDAVNEYIGALKADGGDFRLTLVTFNGYRTRTICEDMAIADFGKFSDYRPNSMTPLVDSAMEIIKSTNKVAEKGDKVLVVILTDGWENYSRKYTNKDLAKQVAKKEKKGWEFVFLGVNIDAYAQAEKYGIRRGSTASVTGAAYAQSMSVMASNTIDWSNAQAASMDFTDEQKEVLEDSSTTDNTKGD